MRWRIASLYGSFLQQKTLEHGLHRSNLATTNKSVISRLLQETYQKDVVSLQNQVRLSRVRTGLNQPQYQTFIQLTQNQINLRQLDLQFWIWDEKYWKSPF